MGAKFAAIEVLLALVLPTGTAKIIIFVFSVKYCFPLKVESSFWPSVWKFNASFSLQDIFLSCLGPRPWYTNFKKILDNVVFQNSLAIKLRLKGKQLRDPCFTCYEFVCCLQWSEMWFLKLFQTWNSLLSTSDLMNSEHLGHFLYPTSYSVIYSCILLKNKKRYTWKSPLNSNIAVWEVSQLEQPNKMLGYVNTFWFL